jgi:hypothetical protein
LSSNKFGIGSSKFVAAVLGLMITVSSVDGAQTVKTEALPSDAGDLGKAFADLAAAFKTADQTRAARLLDSAHWHLDSKQSNWFAQISDALSGFQPSGGKRQGNRATLFVTNKDGYYAMLNATYNGTWRFDTPTPAGSSLSGSGRPCSASATQFPCGALSAPDAQVSGTVQSHMTDPDTKAAMPPIALLDGLAVRMIDSNTKAVRSTWVVLSGTGVNPQMVAKAEDPDQVAGWLGFPVLKLAIAPSGNSAKAEFYNGYSRQEFDVTSGLTISRTAANRIRGTFKSDVKGLAGFDVTFDIGAASTCVADAYQCGG